MELWKPLKYGKLDLSNRIAVSNKGRIKNIQTGTILKQNLIPGGYLGVVISLGHRKQCKSIRVHRAVAMMFCKGYKEGLEVNHIDGNKLNNVAENLEWCTSKYNTNHAIQIGLMKTKSKKIRCINNGKVFDSLKEAAEWCGVSNANNISACARNKYFCIGKDPVTKERVTWEFI